MLVNIQALIDEAQCYEVERQLRWPDGPRCPACTPMQLPNVAFTPVKRIGSEIGVRHVGSSSMT